MCIGQTFPDIVIHDDSQIRVVTHAARRWIYENTTIGGGTDITGTDMVPKIVSLDPRTHQSMQDDGLVVIRDRRPILASVRTSSDPIKERALIDTDDEYDGHRARFERRSLEEYREQREAMRAYVRWNVNNYHGMQEAARKRKALHDNLLDSQRNGNDIS